jgi:phosphotransferase system  glucose/maltose/N-acetylglucosamine-specific IIC component
MNPNQIILLILIFVVLAILFILNIFGKVYVYGGLLNLMKNSSGNYNTGKILMMVSVAIALYFILYFLFVRKQTTRQTRLKEETN